MNTYNVTIIQPNQVSVTVNVRADNKRDAARKAQRIVMELNGEEVNAKTRRKYAIGRIMAIATQERLI